MVLPGIVGWVVVRVLALDKTFRLPILIHPAMLGGWLLQSSQSCTAAKSITANDGLREENDGHPHGLSHHFLFGTLPRLCGADAIIFCNSGGRFQFTNDQCQHISEGCRRPLGRFESIFPTPAGGMKLEKIADRYEETIW
jgi:ribulose-bisphosphate carboxylase large chain